MESNILVSKPLLVAMLMMYLLIDLPNDKMNVVMVQVMLLGFLAVYNFGTLMFYIMALAGPFLCFQLIIAKMPVTKQRRPFLLLTIVLLYAHLIAQHFHSGISLKGYDSAWLIIPEVLFWIISLIVLIGGVRRPLEAAPVYR